MGSSSNARQEREARQAKVAEMQAAQAKAEKRRRAIVIAVVALVVAALAIPAAIVISNAQRERKDVAQVAAEPIEGEVTEEVPSATHVEGEVPPEQLVVQEAETGVLPPMGGDHSQIVQNCGYYAEPVANENAIHSLEHGAVWLAYQPDLAADQVARLQELATANPYLLVSPYPDLASPVVATAWGVQVEMETVDDERLLPFLERYLQGEQTPEPGAPCSGGIGG